jgi:glycosyltransferase involved in cell wall biosynthesis
LKVGFLGRQFGHHGQHTGYHLLAERWQGDKAIYFLPGGVEHHGSERVGVSVPLLDGLTQELAKRRLRSTALHDSVDVLHVLYGEMDLPFPKLPARQKLVATIHQPVSHLSRSQKRIERLKRQLRGVDLCIALSSEQRAFLQSLCPNLRVEFVPHGVDTDFFHSTGEPRDRTVLVSCGWYRDLELAHNVIRELAQKDPGLQIRAYGGGASQLAGASSSLAVLTGLSDEELRREYCSCALMFLPLKETVANNALLEAMSCDTAVVAPALAGVVEYLGETDTCYARETAPSDVAELVCGLVEQATERPKSGLRARALEYRWENVASRMMAEYDLLCA